jgi:hypothetical protein
LEGPVSLRTPGIPLCRSRPMPIAVTTSRSSDIG